MAGRGVAQEEIRFAVVLNGGVSLAIWMGGVVVELDRLTRGTGVYGSLLSMLHSTARADVISGTSAGGINGAALALSQVNEHADLLSLRELWAEQGRMESLLRVPFQGAPPSLLRGDDHFLPQLGAAMRQLARPFKPRGDARELPIELTIRTTLLRGVKTVTVDALGQRLPQAIHEGAFRFARVSPLTHVGEGRPRDDFADDTIEATAARLALASRSTASFPVAFEPSYVPVSGDAKRSRPFEDGEDGQRPNMAGVVNWRQDGSAGDVSRFAVDGGLLANTPTRDALASIGAMPGGGPVRRVMLLVYPHAPVDSDDVPDRPGDMPTLVASSAGLLGALFSQGSRTFVDEVEAHNRRATGQRVERSDILEQVSGSSDELRELADHLLAHYRILRRRRAGRTLAQQVPVQDGWSFKRIRNAAAAAQDTWSNLRGERRRPQVPYVGETLPSEDRASPHWEWGVAGADGVLSAAADLLKRLIEVIDTDTAETVAKHREVLHKKRTRVRAVFDEFDRSWVNPSLGKVQPTSSYWLLRLAAYEHVMFGGADISARQRYQVEALAGLEPDAATAAAKVIDAIFEVEPGQMGRQVATLVGQGVDAVCAVLDLLADEGRARAAQLEWWRAMFPPGTSREAVLARLICLEIVTSSLAGEPPTELDYPVELVQLSLQTKNGFRRYTLTADDKVGGMAILRFSGFLKRSWRVNDWAWGRIDAASTLCQILLKPERLRRVAELEGALTDGVDAHALAARKVNALCEEIFGTAAPETVVTAMKDVRLDAIRELTKVYERSARDAQPTALPRLAELVAWGLHLQIAVEELPPIAAAVRIDQVEGASSQSRGAVFLKENETMLAELEQPAAGPDDPNSVEAVRQRLDLGRRALEAFDRAGIGREPLHEEGTSNQMIRTMTTAVGVAVTVADGEKSGLGAAGKVTKVLRGAALLPYWAVNGLTRGGSTARFLALLGLALGGILVTLALFGLLPEWAAGPGAALGIGTLLGTFAYGALRTASMLHGIVLLSPIIPLVGYAVTTAQRSDDRAISAGQSSAVVIVVLALVVGLILLGSLPAPLGSPLAALYAVLDRTADQRDERRGDRPAQLQSRTGRRIVAAGHLLLRVVVVLAVLSGLGIGVVWLIDNVPDVVEQVRARPLLTWLVVALIVAVALATSYLGGRSLRLWRREGEAGWKDEPVILPAASAAGWAVVYGLVYVVIAAYLVFVAADLTDRAWARAALATCVVFGGTLLLIVPWLLPWLVRRKVRSTLLHDAAHWPIEATADTKKPSLEATQRFLCDRLEAHGVTYRYLCKPNGHGLRLRPTGERIAKTVHAQLVGTTPSARK